MSLQLEEIQPGWTVVDASGEELGTVIGIDSDAIRIQRKGLTGGVWTAPRDSVAEVETRRVELRLKKQDLG
jgi:hypothetical protein